MDKSRRRRLPAGGQMLIIDIILAVFGLLGILVEAVPYFNGAP